MTRPVLLMAACCAIAAAQAPQPVAIRNARIVTVSGPVLAKGTVLLRNGLIDALGDNVPIPPGAWIVEGDGLTVYPGLIDALSNWGMPANLLPPAAGGRGRGPQNSTPAHGPEDRPATTSWIKAADELQISDARLERARNAGYASAVTFPMRGIFAGQGAVVNLAGERAGETVLIPSAGQYITMSPSGNGFPAALMGTIAYIRQVYLDAEHYTAVKDAYNRDPRGMRRPDYDRALEGVLESKRILLPANRKVEIERMLGFAAELKQPAILYGMQEGYRAAEILKNAGATVLVSLKWPEKAKDSDPESQDQYRTLELRDRAPSTPAELSKAGVRFALYSDGLDQSRDLQRAVKRAIDAGLSREAAVRALTLTPAEIYGVSDRLGSIEKGKIGNLVVTRGDIFEDDAKVEMVFIDGVRYLPAPEPAAGGATRPNSNRRDF